MARPRIGKIHVGERQEKRKIIRADIKRQIRERAIAKSKAEKGE